MPRTRPRARLAAALLALAPFLPAPADAAPTRVIVRLRGRPDVAALGGTPGEVAAALRAAHARTFRGFAARAHALPSLAAAPRPLWIAHAAVLEVESRDVPALEADPAVHEVVPVRRLPAPRLIPGEPGPETTGDAVWSVARVRAPEVWTELGIDGSGVVVGHIDSGVDPDHPDLAGKILAFRDFMEDGGAGPRDGNGHGTHTAGSIVGGASAGTAIGVAPGARLVVARVFDQLGTSTEIILAAMQWVMDPDGDPATDDAPRVVSNSWGADTQTDLVFWEAVEAWRAAGMLPVFAAGNAGPEPRSAGIPAVYPHALAVGATDSTDAVTGFSGRGPVAWDGAEVLKPDIAAPGAAVISAKDGGGYFEANGTSMACPHVAGVAALVAAAHPDADLDAIEAALRASARDLGPAGPDMDTGHGLVDARAAIAWLGDGVLTGRVVDETGAPLLARVESREHAVETGLDGRFLLRLGGGTHALAIEAFAHARVSTSFEIPPGQSLEVEVRLRRLPGAPVTVAFRDHAGAPVATRVRALAAPGPATATGADGEGTLWLPAGTHRLRGVAPGHRPAHLEVEVGAEPTRVEIALAPAAATLLVDDDGGAPHEALVMEALADRPGGADLLDASAMEVPHPEELLAPYASVVWTTGGREGPPSPAALRALGRYLDADGRLLMAGHHLAQGLDGAPFMVNRLRAGLHQAELSTGGVSPAGDDLAGALPRLELGGPGLPAGLPDALWPLRPSGRGFLRFQMRLPWTLRHAGVLTRRGPRATMLMGFALEAVEDPADRAALLAACLGWLEASSHPGGPGL